MSGSLEPMEQPLVNVTASATTQVYTPTTAINTTTFFRRAAYSTYGGKHVRNIVI